MEVHDALTTIDPDFKYNNISQRVSKSETVLRNPPPPTPTPEEQSIPSRLMFFFFLLEKVLDTHARTHAGAALRSHPPPLIGRPLFRRSAANTNWNVREGAQCLL